MIYYVYLASTLVLVWGELVIRYGLAIVGG